MKRLVLISLTLILALPLWLGAKEVVGVNELITLLPENIPLEAKLDTGADSSSIDARNIEYFTENGDEWVRFTLPRSRTENKKSYQLEYPLVGTTKIVSRIITAEQGPKGRSYHRRPVINMQVCIGDEIRTIEVNLIDRSNFKYPFLLGASGLEKFDFLVDVQGSDILPRECLANKPAPTTFDYRYLYILLGLLIVIAAGVFLYKRTKR